MPDELKDILRQTKGGEIPALEIYEVFFKIICCRGYMVKGAKDLAGNALVSCRRQRGNISKLRLL